MAHIDLDQAEMIFRERPAATSPAFPQRQIEEAPRVRAPLPTFSRITVGQIVRTLLLVAVCVGFWQIPHAQKFAPRGAVATPTLKPF